MMETFSSDFARTFVPNDDTIVFSGTGDTGSVGRAAGDTIITTGINQTVNLSITGDVMTIVDQGSGLNLGLNEGVADVTVQGFQNDPTAHVTLVVPTAVPSLVTDDNGGTLLTVQNNGVPGTVVDFVKDPTFTMSQISGGSQPPPPTTFVLDGGNSSLGLSTGTAMVFGHGGNVSVTGAGVVRDNGADTHITVGSNTTAIVYGAYWDLGSTLQQTGVSAASLAASIRPDGHGGTLIGTGSTSVDLMYDVYVRPSQLLDG